MRKIKNQQNKLKVQIREGKKALLKYGQETLFLKKWERNKTSQIVLLYASCLNHFQQQLASAKIYKVPMSLKTMILVPLPQASLNGLSTSERGRLSYLRSNNSQVMKAGFIRMISGVSFLDNIPFYLNITNFNNKFQYKFYQ